MLFCWFVFTYKQIGISETLKFGKYFWFHSNGTYSEKFVFLKEYTLSKNICHYRAILISWNHFRKIRDKSLSKVVESCNYLIWESFSFVFQLARILVFAIAVCVCHFRQNVVDQIFRQLDFIVKQDVLNLKIKKDLEL